MPQAATQAEARLYRTRKRRTHMKELCRLARKRIDRAERTRGYAERTIAEIAGRRYAEAYGGEAQDYAQQALLVIEESRTRWHPILGEWRSYVTRAVYRSLFGYASKMKAPVHGGTHKLKLLACVRTLPADELVGNDALAATVPDDPEVLHAADEWQRQVSTRIQAVFDGDPNGDGDMARLVLLHERPAEQVADQFACPKWRVFRATLRARRELANDDTLRALVQEASW